MRPYDDCSFYSDEELKIHARENGYIYMKNFLDTESNLKMKKNILKYCEDYGCVVPDTEKYKKGTQVDTVKGGVGPEEYFLGDIPMEKGVLVVSPGSHLKGPVPESLRKYDTEAGMLGFIPDDDVEFIGNDLNSGDLIAFQCQTIHKVTENTTDDIRLSIDIRFQPSSDPVNKYTLYPHTRILEWEDIYKNFKNYDEKYYWQDMNLQIGEFDVYNLLKTATSFK